MSSYILKNGQLIHKDEFSLTLTNRSFRYGDGLFETIKVSDGFPLFYRTHHSRLIRGLDALGMTIPETFTFVYFKERLLSLIQDSKILNGKLRCHAYRSGEGNYTPKSSAFDWVVEIETSQHNTPFYHPQTGEYRLGSYLELNKQHSKISFFKSANAQIYVLAGLFAKRNKVENALIFNQDNMPIETIAENIFLFKNGRVFFPRIEDGPIEGVMRTVVKKLLIWNKIDFEERSITIEDLSEAEEIFLTNVTSGIKSVTHFAGKSYSNTFAIGLQAKLEERIANILGNRMKH